MREFEADTTALRASADTIANIGEQAGTVDFGAAMRAVTGGLPGSQAAVAAARLAETWTGGLRSWEAQLHGYQADLRSAADRYEASDHAADRIFAVWAGERVH